jgi:hypothetical protein
MNVTTEKSECDPKQRIRQLEVAIEHALVAALHPNRPVQTASCGTVEVSYPSFEFRETLKMLRPNPGLNGIWVVIDLGSAATLRRARLKVSSSSTTSPTKCLLSARFR